MSFEDFAGLVGTGIKGSVGTHNMPGNFKMLKTFEFFAFYILNMNNIVFSLPHKIMTVGDKIGGIGIHIFGNDFFLSFIQIPKD